MSQGKNALAQTEKLAIELLSEGMLKTKTLDDVKAVVKVLCTRTSFHSHGSVIDSCTAKKLGLQIDELNSSDLLWKKLWLLHSMYSFDSNASGVGKFFEGRKLSRCIKGHDPQPRNL